MTPHPHEPSRANEIWKRFAGMFGADALERKFGKTPPPEWQAMLTRLKDYEIDRGVRRLAYSGKPGVPSLPEFTRLCRMLADDSVDEGPQRIALPSPDTFRGDVWDTAANTRLLKHITTALAAKSDIFGPVPVMQHEYRDGKKVGLKSVPSPQQVETTAILLAYKKAWCRDMREYVDLETGEIGRPSLAEQNRTWDGTMARAMADIAEKFA
jgi:hypothetical protein